MPPLANASEYEGFNYVTEVEGVKQAELYNGVRLWIAENFKSAKQVIDLENREDGILIGNGVIPNIKFDGGMGIVIPNNASFKMKVEVRDGKIRLTFTQFQIEGRYNSTLFKQEAVQIKAVISRFGDGIAQSLKNKSTKEF